MGFDTENVEEVKEVSGAVEEEVTQVPTDDLQESIEEYQPSYAYTVKDEEKHFDDRFKDIITTKETEDYIRDLYTRADGLDGYKEKVATYETDLDGYRDRLSQMQTGFNTLKQYRESGDYRKLFTALGVDEQNMLEYAYKVAQEHELPEEQRADIQGRREQDDRLASLETQLREQNEYRQNMTVQNELNELEGYVNTHSELNGLMKTAGFNLRDEVLSYGITQTKITGKEPSIGEAVNTVVERFKGIMTAQQPQQQQQTLPNVVGTNQTAPQKHYTLDELRAMSNKIH